MRSQHWALAAVFLLASGNVESAPGCVSLSGKWEGSCTETGLPNAWVIEQKDCSQVSWQGAEYQINVAKTLETSAHVDTCVADHAHFDKFGESVYSLNCSKLVKGFDGDLTTERLRFYIKENDPGVLQVSKYHVDISEHWKVDTGSKNALCTYRRVN